FIGQAGMFVQRTAAYLATDFAGVVAVHAQGAHGSVVDVGEEALHDAAAEQHGGGGRRRAAGATWRAFAAFRRPPPPCAALVAASIPMANPSRPQPANRRGNPVALSTRENQ